MDFEVVYSWGVVEAKNITKKDLFNNVFINAITEHFSKVDLDTNGNVDIHYTLEKVEDIMYHVLSCINICTNIDDDFKFTIVIDDSEITIYYYHNELVIHVNEDWANPSIILLDSVKLIGEYYGEQTNFNYKKIGN